MNLKYNSIDVYFHMTNHYKKLRSVKSVVDTSSPLGYCERQSRPPSRATHRRETHQNDELKIRNDKFKSSLNSPLNKKYETRCTNLIRSESVSTRPQTRRRLVDMPNTEVCPQRAKSSGPFVKEKSSIPKLRLSKSNRSSRYNSPSNSSTPRSSNQHRSNSSRSIQIDNRKAVLKESEPPIPAPRKTKKRRNAIKNWIVEHDYMEFMLRITEDIIQNNLYTKEEILQVLNSHIEANVERLLVPKMMKQIRILCHELNVPFDKILINNSSIKAEFMEPLDAIEKNLICTCNSVLDEKKYELGDCECATKRSLPFQCVLHNKKYEIDDLLKITQDFSPSQSIIETYYFKNANDPANSKQITSLNNNERTDQESTNTLLNSPICVPELSAHLQSLEVATICNNKPETSQSFQKTSPKTTMKHKHPCNCNKSKQCPLHSHINSNRSSNGDENVQSQNNTATLENSVSSISNQVTQNVFSVGCPCSNPTEPSPILTGPLDFALYCTNVPDVHNKHQVNQIQIPNSAVKIIDKTRKDQDEISGLKEIKTYPLPVIEKQNFLKKNESFCERDEEFLLSLGTAYMPTSVSHSNSGSLFENVCVIAPDAIDKCKLIVLKNLPKQNPPVSEMSEQPKSCSDLNTSYIIEAPQNNSTSTVVKNSVSTTTKNNSLNKCAQISTVGTTMGSKYSSKAGHDKNKKTNYKTIKNVTISDKTSKNIFIILPDDIKQDQIFVVRKSQFEKLDTQSTVSDESECQIIKDVSNISQTKSSMASCMNDIHDAASYHSSTCSKPVHKIKKSFNVNNIEKTQFDEPNMITSSNNIDSSKTASTAAEINLKNSEGNNSFISGNAFLHSVSKACDTNICIPKILLKLNDYDLTPQRDNNSNNCRDNNQRHISFSSTKNSLENYKSNKDKLLLGNEYEINSIFCSSDYSKGIPDCIKQFYPNTASQTESSDFLTAIKSMSESRIPTAHDLEHTVNSNSNVDNHKNVNTMSQSSLLSTPSIFQREKEKNMEILKQDISAQLDLILDIELNSEEQNQKKMSLPKQTGNISNDTIYSEDQEIQISSSTSISDEVLVSVKSKHELKASTSLNFVKTDQFPESYLKITKNVDDDKDETLSTKKSATEITLHSAFKSYLQRSTGFSELTDSQLMLLFENEHKTTNSKGNSIESENRVELNQLREKSKIKNAGNKEIVEPNRQDLQVVNKNLFDNNVNDENDDYTNTKKEEMESFSKSSRINDLNLIENDVNAEKENSLKPVEIKMSASNPQRRVLIKENIVEHKEPSVEYNISSRQDSVPLQLPFIQIEEPDTKSNTNNANLSSSDSTQTWCCGLKPSKMKARRDVLEVDKCLQTIPNISSVPYDQLFEVEVRRPTSTLAGYGPDRKSLRFDYSMMRELSTVEGEQPKPTDAKLPTDLNTINTPVNNPELTEAELFDSETTDTKSIKLENNSENSSTVIDIYKELHDDSGASFLIDNTNPKEKNNESLQD